MNGKSILEMNHNEAREFFMEPASYFNVILPKYFNLKDVLSQAQKVLNKHLLNSLRKSSPAKLNIDKLNYPLFINENGKYDWEPLYLIHPLIYVDLANYITIPKVWRKIIYRFKSFELNNITKSYSIPFKNNNKNTYVKTNRQNLKKDIINNYTKYNFCVTTHIINCYGSVYTHTIPWAIEGKHHAKHCKDDKNAGNRIDKRLRNLQYGQTDGIPQGNLIFDFLIELILSYADFKLYKNIKKTTIKDCSLLRYKNKYFIFTKYKNDADVIMKWLLIELEDLNMRFNGKTTHIFKSKDMIMHITKPDEVYKSILINISKHMNLREELLQIQTLSKKFPNSKSITNELYDCYKKLISIVNENKKKYHDIRHIVRYLLKTDTSNQNKENKKNYYSLIDIILSIIIKNPSSFLMGIFLISSILNLIYNEQIRLKDNTIKDRIKKEIRHIKKSFNGMVHTEYSDIWLQRLELCIKDLSDVHSADNPRYRLFNKVLDPKKEHLWASNWMYHGFDESHMIDNNIIKDMRLQIDPSIVKMTNELYGEA